MNPIPHEPSRPRTGAVNTPTGDLHARIRELEERNRELERELARLNVYKDFAYTDVLTGVPNRRMYEERLGQEVARAQRGRHPLALALIDLDRLKSINDRVGHRGGDDVLARFARFVRTGLRQPDTFCRIGGDEFAVILPDTSATNARVSMERLRRNLAGLDLRLDGGPHPVELSFSCGIAGFQLGMSAGELAEQADSALYDAKARGRNRLSIAVGPALSPFVN